MAALLLIAYENTPSGEREAGLQVLLQHLRLKERFHVQQVISELNDPFSKLPLEILICVFDYLHPFDVWRQRLVCNRWRSALSSEDFEETALARLESHHPSDTVELRNPVKSRALRMRNIRALRLGLPFYFRETRANVATGEEPRTVQEYALKGHYFAYLRGKRQESNAVVVRNLLQDVSTTLCGDAREKLFALALSHKVIAFATYQGFLYVAQLPLTGQVPSRIRLPSSAVVSLTADGSTVAALLHSAPERTYVVLICEVGSLRTSTFEFQTGLVYDAEGHPHHGRAFSPGAMLVDCSKRSIDIFSSAYITMPCEDEGLADPPSYRRQLLMRHTRFSFDGEGQTRSDIYVKHIPLLNSPGNHRTRNPFVLAEIYSTGRSTEFGVDVGLLEWNQRLTWTVMFDSHSTRLYQPQETLKDLSTGMVSDWLRYWKDRVYSVAPTAQIFVWARNDPTRNDAGNLGSQPLNVIGDEGYYVHKSILLLNDTYMVIMRPGNQFLQILVFNEQVTAQPYLSTGLWPLGGEKVALRIHEEGNQTQMSRYSELAKNLGIADTYDYGVNDA